MSARVLGVRPATVDDVDAIVRIERESFSDPWSARSFRELVVQPNVVCAVAESTDAGIVGFSVVYLAGTEGDLANLATAASARRAGVGRQLLEHVLAQARARGVRTIFLEVRESNHSARALYSSAGFVDVGRRKKYYARPVEDALVLRKELS